MSTPWQVIDVPTPPADVTPDWEWMWVYEGVSRIRRAHELAVWGQTDKWAPAHVLVHFLVDVPWRRTVVRVAVREGGSTAADVVGALEVSLDADDHAARLSLHVDPQEQGRGIGTALAVVAEQVLAENDRTTAMAWTQQAPEAVPGAGVVTAPTGSGRVDLDERAARFATGRGYTLEQVVRASQLDVPTDTGALAAMRRDAAATAGPDYRVHTWVGAVPAEYHGPLADLWARMSTDAPSAGLEVEPEVWDAARVAGLLDRLAAARQQIVLSVAEHVPTGELAAFTEIQAPDFEGVDFGFQGDTLVKREHRGRRLGMLVKTANLIALVGRRPGVRRLHTSNAEENRSMLAINEALGFRALGVYAAWQKRLGDSGAS